MKFRFFLQIICVVSIILIASCTSKTDKQEEQLTVKEAESENVSGEDTLLNAVLGNATMKQIATFPSQVILTGMNDHRLISLYKSKPPTEKETSIFKRSYDSYSESRDEFYEHFMPGLDILYGYNLLNIAHYDLKAEKLNFLFDHPVLVKTLYYPSFTPDSLDKLPINRNYYLVSVYDEDSNKDTVINKKDLRRLYLFDEHGMNKIQVIPADHSVIRSQYDSKNDIAYIFARQDENKNGAQDIKEPIHIFWFSLKAPGIAKRMY